VIELDDAGIVAGLECNKYRRIGSESCRPHPEYVRDLLGRDVDEAVACEQRRTVERGGVSVQVRIVVEEGARWVPRDRKRAHPCAGFDADDVEAARSEISGDMAYARTDVDD